MCIQAENRWLQPVLASSQLPFCRAAKSRALRTDSGFHPISAPPVWSQAHRITSLVLNLLIYTIGVISVGAWETVQCLTQGFSAYYMMIHIILNTSYYRYFLVWRQTASCPQNFLFFFSCVSIVRVIEFIFYKLFNLFKLKKNNNSSPISPTITLHLW